MPDQIDLAWVAVYGVTWRRGPERHRSIARVVVLPSPLDLAGLLVQRAIPEGIQASWGEARSRRRSRRWWGEGAIKRGHPCT